MMRKPAIALVAGAAICLMTSSGAFAGGHGGGGGHEGFHHEGFHHEGFHEGFHGGFHRHAFFGFGFGPYPVGGYPYYDNYDDAGCYLVRRRVWTPYGWRIRRVAVCS
jgi:hypothetical protein